MTPEQAETDRLARLTISRELGHEREQIMVAYLGRRHRDRDAMFSVVIHLRMPAIALGLEACRVADGVSPNS